MKLMRILLKFAAIRRTSPASPTPATPAVAEKTPTQLPVKGKQIKTTIHPIVNKIPHLNSAKFNWNLMF
jgi:hypothetical protein